MEPWEDLQDLFNWRLKSMHFAGEADPDLALILTPGRYGPHTANVTVNYRK